MIRAVIAALLCLFIAGCADGPSKIVTQQIEVQVPTKREPPKALVDCAYKEALPVWYPVDGKPDWAALDAEGQRRTRDLITTINGCNASWRAWATAP